MILNSTKDVDYSIDDEGQDFGIDTSSIGVLIEGFTNNLYSNKIGSIVREITSNCFDAHKELGIQKDIEISIHKAGLLDNSQSKISFRDFGVGLSPERINKIYSKYFASTKRTGNNQIGGFGIGAKSPLSYTDSFEVFTIVDGIKYHYLMSRGAQVPRIDLLNKEESDEPRGSEIVIPIKNLSDLIRFEDELKEQLKYFDNINYYGVDISNDYQIVKGKHFITRLEEGNASSSGYMEACIGTVSYPIDYSQMGWYMEHYKSPIALRFDIGDLSVTMNREAIEYTEGAVEIIKKKFEEYSLEIESVIHKELEKEEDLDTYIKMSKDLGRVMLNGTFIPLPRSSQEYFTKSVSTWVFEPFKNFKYIKPKSVYTQHIVETKAEMSGGTLSKAGVVTNTPVSNLIGKDIYRTKESIRRLKTLYVNETFSKSYFIIGISHFDRRDFRFHFTNVRGPLNDEEAAILDKEIEIYRKYVLKYVISKSKSFDKIEVPEAWLKHQKSLLGDRKIDKSVITIRHKKSYNNYYKAKYPVSQLHEYFKLDSFLIYGFQGEEHDMSSIAYKLNTLGIPENTKYFKIARGNEKWFKDFPKAYHWSAFPKPYLWELENKQEAHQRIVNDSLGLHLDTLKYNNAFLQFLTPKEQATLERLSYIKNNKHSKGVKVFLEPVSREAYLWDLKLQVNLNHELERFKDYFETYPLMLKVLNSIKLDSDKEASEFLIKALKKHFKPFKFTK